MQPNNPMFKGSLSTIVLKLLSEHNRLYGYELTKMVKDLTKGELNITEGALYPTLHRLEHEGLLEVEIEQVGNRQRKYYMLTKTGKKESVKKIKEILSFFEQMRVLLDLPNNVAKM